MGFINFAQGNKENYNAQEMQDTIYLSGDSKELLFNDKSYGNAIPADEEDITAESGNLKLKDRSYDEASFSGKGYVILRKNISEEKNILTQEMINQPNTIYEIRYDFDLNEASITIPENCILKFNGGYIKNGTIDFNHCNISAENNIQLFQDITLSNIHYVSVKWFGAIGDSETDDTEALKTALLIENCVSFIPTGIYKITSSINANTISCKWVGDSGNDASWSNYSKNTTGSVIYCVGENIINEEYKPFIYLPREASNIVFIGEKSDVYTPKYQNTYGVQLCESGSWMNHCSYNNITIKYFGYGLILENCFDIFFNFLNIHSNQYGIYIPNTVTQDIDSGYITLMKIENYSITDNKVYGIYSPNTGTTNIEFNHGYIEGNGSSIDEDDRYQVYMPAGGKQIVFNYLYSEARGSFGSFGSSSRIYLINAFSDTLSRLNYSYTIITMINCKMTQLELQFSIGGYTNLINSQINNIKNLSGNQYPASASSINIISSNISSMKNENVFNNNFSSFSLFSVEDTNSISDCFPIISQTGINQVFAKNLNQVVIPRFNRGSRYNDVYGFTASALSGTERPTLYNTDTGKMFYDTVINKPIYWNGTAWVDADGNNPDVEQSNWALIE